MNPTTEQVLSPGEIFRQTRVPLINIPLTIVGSGV